MVVPLLFLFNERDYKREASVRNELSFEAYKLFERLRSVNSLLICDHIRISMNSIMSCYWDRTDRFYL